MLCAFKKPLPRFRKIVEETADEIAVHAVLYDDLEKLPRLTAIMFRCTSSTGCAKYAVL